MQGGYYIHANMIKEYVRKRICRVAHTDELLEGLFAVRAENERLKDERAAMDRGGTLPSLNQN